MATTLYFRAYNSTGKAPKYSTGNNDTKLNDSASGWYTDQNAMLTTQDTLYVESSVNTVNGATNGIEIGSPDIYYSPPLDADVTISGTITFNLWASETSMSANAAINCVIDKIDGATGVITQIIKTARTTELGTSLAAANFTGTPTSTVVKKGDRLRFRWFADDAGTMSSGYQVIVRCNSSTGGDNADSYVTFTETFGLITTDPTGTTFYPTDVASGINPGSSIERVLSLSRGAGVQNDVTNTVNGWTTPIQVTDTAGGTAVEWYTKPLNAFTLGGAVFVNARWLESNAAATAAFRCEIAVCGSDGTNPVVWGVNSYPLEIATTETAYQYYISGDDTSVENGQRIRVRFFVDDTSYQPLVTSYTATLYYAGTSGGASGDTYLTFTQTITEAPTTVYAQAQAQAQIGGAVTTRAYSQAQAQIKVFGVKAYAQALALIPPKWVFSQATALINGAYYYYESVMSEPGLVSYWRLGEASGNPQDSKGTNHVTTVGGTPTYGVAGALYADLDTALGFDGSTEYLSVPDHASLDLGDGPFSLECWFSRSGTGIADIFDKGPNEGPAFAVEIDGAGFDNVLFRASTGGIFASSSVLVLPSTGWHHVVCTKNGPFSHIYVDGVDVTILGTNVTLGNSSDPLVIGRRQIGSDRYLSGTLDEVAIYNYALTPAQVRQHYLTGKGIETTVVDTFTRTVSNGLGTADTGGAWSIDTGSNLDFDVDGAIATVSGTGSHYFSLPNTLIPPSNTEAYFDLRFSDIPTSIAINISTQIGSMENASSAFSGFYIETLANGNCSLSILYSGISYSYYNTTISSNIFYRIKFQHFRTNTRTTFRIKIWDLAQAEPTYVDYGTTFNNLVSPGHFGITLYANMSLNTDIDNINVYQGVLAVLGQAQAKIIGKGTAYGQAQSDIKQTYRGYTQAQADIKQTYRGYAQAQAAIRVTTYAQSQADIKQTYRSFAQSQADIKQTYKSYAQAQSDIKAIGRGFGQANADIKAISRVFAQAQANIKATYQAFAQAQADTKAVGSGFAQSQADIKAVYQVFAQAQAHIKAFNVTAYAQALSNVKGIDIEGVAQAQTQIKAIGVKVFAQAQATAIGAWQYSGQAQADIKAVGQAFSQAQADIKQLYQVFAQSNADIKQVYRAFAQAQSDIKQAYQVFAQAQSDIKTTYRAFAQSQSDIKQVYQGYAQAQACIRVTTYAQANAWIEAIYQGSAQAQARIKQAYPAFAQAQAQIKQAYQAYGQAQADIKQTYLGFGQAQGAIKVVYQSYGQAQAWCYIPQIARPISDVSNDGNWVGTVRN